MGIQLFISDLHLSDKRPDTLRFFLDFLQNQTQDCEALYILGDLFDAWIGDDALPPTLNPLINALKALSSRGCQLSLMHGNRDFLLGSQFCQLTRAHLLEDPSIIEIRNQRILLMHGDLLCTDDIAYQEFRQQIRNPSVIEQFLSQPIAARIEIAADYRRKSGEANSTKAADIMDVNADSVLKAMQEALADSLIHGHTHRPGKHSFHAEGKTLTRYVLSEWSADRATILRADANGLNLIDIHPGQIQQNPH